MSTVPYTFRVERSVKDEFDAICQAIGMNAATAFNLYIRRVIADRAIPFTLSVPESKDYDGFSSDDEVLEFTKAVSRKALNETR
jgi:addiction module RelB/DinJ family antitoxin